MTGQSVAAAAVRILAALATVNVTQTGTDQTQSPSSRYVLRWEQRGKNAIVTVSGIPASVREAVRKESWTQDRWSAILSVVTTRPSELNKGTPMSGRYSVTDVGFQFTPAFPLQPNVRYYAVFRPAELPQADPVAPVLEPFSLLRRSPRPTVVRQIYPTASLLPENLLKFYVHFSGPMNRGGIYRHIRLLGDNGREVDLPFLEIDEELWNPEMTRVTLFIDPGRIKRGVKPLEDIGPALESGKSFTLVISREWRDAAGNPLKQEYRKRFKVGPPDRTAIDPRRWRIQQPRAGTRNPLKADLGEAIDHALGLRLLQVMNQGDKPIAGKASLSEGERRWMFAPSSPWIPGRYSLVAATTLEDLAGNNIGKPFEVDVFKKVQRRLTSETVRLPFRVR